MSEPPEGERLTEYLVALTRLENPGAPSLRESVAGALGVDYQTMLDSPGEYAEDLGMTYAEAADIVYETSVDLIETLAEHDFDVPKSEREARAIRNESRGEGGETAGVPDDEVNMNLLVVDLETIGDGRAKSGAHNDLRKALAYICGGPAQVQGPKTRFPELPSPSQASTCRRGLRRADPRRRRPAADRAELLHARPAQGAGEGSLAGWK